MKYQTLIVEKKEHELLKHLMMSQSSFDRSQRGSFEKLSRELASAKIVAEDEMPEDVVRFNSMVTIKTPWNVQRPYQIVTPERSNLKENRISVVAPMSLALFGCAKGDEIEWQFPTGRNTIKILDVVQAKPEPTPDLKTKEA